MEKDYVKNDELHISIKDFVMRFCLKWRKAVVLMVLFAMLMDAFAIVRSYKQAKTIQENQNLSDQQIAENKMDEANNLVESYKEKLTDRELEEVERSVASYEDLLQKYNKAISYNNKSIKMKLNPNQVPTVVLNYNIDTHYEVTYPVIEKRDKAPDIAYALESSITSGDIYKKIGEQINLDEESSYLAELIQVEYFENSNFSITVNYLNRDDCILIAEILNEYIMAEAKNLKENMGGFEIILTSDNYSEGPNADILAAQASQANNINVIKNALNNLFYGLTEDQKNCYYAILDQNKLERMEEDNYTNQNSEAEITEKEQTQMTGEVKIIHVKYIFLGIIIGMLLYAVIIFIKYVASDELKTTEDIENIYKLPLLGQIDITKRKGIDKKIEVAFQGETVDSAEEQQEYVCANVLLYAERCDSKKIFVMSSSMNQQIDEMMQSIVDKLRKEKIEISFGKSSLHSAESLKKLMNMDAVIIVEKIDTTNTKELEKLINQCCFQNIPVLGGVILK